MSDVWVLFPLVPASLMSYLGTHFKVLVMVLILKSVLKTGSCLLQFYMSVIFMLT